MNLLLTSFFNLSQQHSFLLCSLTLEEFLDLRISGHLREHRQNGSLSIWKLWVLLIVGRHDVDVLALILHFIIIKHCSTLDALLLIVLSEVCRGTTTSHSCRNSVFLILAEKVNHAAQDEYKRDE